MLRDVQTKKFNQLLDHIKKIHGAKNHDYATDQDSLSNLKLCRMLGLNLGSELWFGSVTSSVGSPSTPGRVS